MRAGQTNLSFAFVLLFLNGESTAQLPLVEALEPWLREKLQLISQKTKLAKAIRYALSRWPGLCLFLDDGRIEIDKNVV